MIITSSQVETHQSYDPTYFERLFAIEDRHFWFRARNQVIAHIVRQITTSLAPGYRVLELGCGTGNVLRMLVEICPLAQVVGMDLFAEGLRFARRRTNGGLICGDVNHPPVAATFEVIGVFDVLEHLPDDVAILAALRRMLSPGGYLILTVPAYQSLWSYFDEASHHCRRYEAQELESKLIQAGYRIEYLTPFMAALFPLIWLGRRLSSLFGSRKKGETLRADGLAVRELRIIPLVNELLYAMLTQEVRSLVRRQRLPIGASLLAVVS